MMGTGDQSGTWSVTNNTNIGTLLEEAIAGMAVVVHNDSADYTLTASNGATDEARQAVLEITGTLTAGRNVVCPTQQKIYLIYNNTGGGFDVTLKTTAGTGIAVPSGKSMFVRCDGTDVVDAITNLPSGITLGGVEVVTLSASQALTNKTIDGDLNTLSNLDHGAEVDNPSSGVHGVAGNLVGTSDAQTLTNKVISGGTIDAAPIGGTTPAAGAFTTVGATGNVTGANLSGTNTGDNSAASDTVAGVVELATAAETATGTDTTRAVTPAGASAHYSPETREINVDTGTALTAALTDSGNMVTMSNASANVFTIPANATVAFVVGTQIDVIQLGAGVTSITGAVGVTLNGISAGSGALSAQYAGVTLVKHATNTWTVSGAVGAVA